MEQFASEFIKANIGNFIPMYFVVIGVAIFVIFNRNAGYQKKGLVFAIIGVCILSSLATLGDACIREYFGMLGTKARECGFETTIDYIQAYNLDVDKHLLYNDYRFFFSALGYCFRMIFTLHAFYMIKQSNFSKASIILALPCIVACIFYLTSNFTHFCVYFDDINFFFHATNYCYYLAYIIAGYYCVLIFKELFTNYGYKNDYRSVIIITYLMFFTILIMVINAEEYLNLDISVIDTVMLMSMSLYYLMLEKNASYQAYKQQEKALTESKIATLTSQIRPHFIFNCISNIAELINDKSPAKKALLGFAKYLRINLNALNKTSAMPFSNELDYIENYILLEQLRYPKEFKIEYDVKTKNFLVPLVSVEVFVENAIKHNVLKKDLIIVKLSTYKTDYNYVVEIKDNGVGFDPSVIQDNGKYVGTYNAKYRLEKMVNATVIFDSKEGEGTTVTIKIPMSKENSI